MLLHTKPEVIHSLFSPSEYWGDAPPGESRHFKNEKETHALTLRNLVINQPAADLLRVTWWDKWQLSCYFQKASSDIKIKQRLGKWDTTFIQPWAFSKRVPSSHPSLLLVLQSKQTKAQNTEHWPTPSATLALQRLARVIKLGNCKNRLENCNMLKWQAKMWASTSHSV